MKAEPDQLQTLAQDKMVMQKGGFLYVYTSNETPQNVFFDNLTVTTNLGAVLEETHYYPFGLTMSGISSKVPGILENKKEKFQGQPLDNELGLNWYGFKWRNHDPQIGRFVQINPLSADYVHNSTYAFSENKVISHIELEGLESLNAKKINNPALRRILRENVQEKLKEFNDNAGKSFSVTGSVGLGVGIKAKLGTVGTEAFLNGPQLEGTVTAGGKVTTSLDKLFANNRNISVDDSVTLDLKRKFLQLHQQSGAFSSFRLVKTKKVGDDIAA